MSDAAVRIPAPSEVEVFPRAPVSEAILGLALPYLDDLSAYIKPFHEAVRDSFPECEPIEVPDTDEYLWPGTSNGHRIGRKGEPAGYRISSEDKLQVVQITRRAVTYHRLRPYVDWAHFAEGAIPVWRAFTSTFKPEFVSGLRLRYLNRIEIPRPFGDLEEYFTLLPKIPQPVDTGFSGYLMRITLLEPQIGAFAHVTQLGEYEANQPFLPVIFDIDVRMNYEVSAEVQTLWAAVEALRDYKNRIFFSGITEKTRGLFR